MSEAPFTVYGDDDGPVYERVCPNCGRFVKMPKSVRVYFDDRVKMADPAICAKCGPVYPQHIGWKGDFMEEA